MGMKSVKIMLNDDVFSKFKIKVRTSPHLTMSTFIRSEINDFLKERKRR